MIRHFAPSAFSRGAGLGMKRYGSGFELRLVRSGRGRYHMFRNNADRITASSANAEAPHEGDVPLRGAHENVLLEDDARHDADGQQPAVGPPRTEGIVRMRGALEGERRRVADAHGAHGVGEAVGDAAVGVDEQRVEGVGELDEREGVPVVEVEGLLVAIQDGPRHGVAQIPERRFDVPLKRQRGAAGS